MMGKSKDSHEREIIAIIKEKKIMRIQHIFAHYLDIKSSQFYNLELEKSEDIKEALSNNRSKGTDYLLQKWIASDNATLQIAAFRLICTPEEHQMLNQQYLDHTSKGEKITPVIEVNNDRTKANLEKLMND